MSRYESGVEIVPYSQKRAGDFEPWDLETLVEAQRLECRGADYQAIADALGRNVEDVAQRLADPADFPRARAERAHVGFTHLKGR